MTLECDRKSLLDGRIVNMQRRRGIMQSLWRTELGLLMAALWLALLIGCGNRSVSTPLAIPAIPLSPKPAAGTIAPLTWAKMKQTIRTGMPESQLRKAFGIPYE